MKSTFHTVHDTTNVVHLSLTTPPHTSNSLYSRSGSLFLSISIRPTFVPTVSRPASVFINRSGKPWIVTIFCRYETRREPADVSEDGACRSVRRRSAHHTHVRAGPLREINR